MRNAFILDIICLVLCLVLLFLGNTDLLPHWALAIGAIIALIALIASIYLFVKARKIERAENRRIEAAILENAAKEDAVDKAIEDGDIVDEPDVKADEQDDYKTDDE